jgi:hypothetical protein
VVVAQAGGCADAVDQVLEHGLTLAAIRQASRAGMAALSGTKGKSGQDRSGADRWRGYLTGKALLGGQTCATLFPIKKQSIY